MITSILLRKKLYGDENISDADKEDIFNCVNMFGE